MGTAVVTPDVSESLFSIPDTPAVEDLEIRGSDGLPESQEDFDTLLETAREFGRRYDAPYFKAEGSFREAFAQHVDDFIRLREMFPVERSHATRPYGTRPGGDTCGF